MKILLVEDDEFLQRMYSTKFKLAGFEVEMASDGQTGLEKMKSFKPDIVLMDVMMPKLNGIDATTQAKADPEIKDIPILILTNLSGSDDAHAAVAKGAVGFLVKSDFTPKEIVEKVKEIISKKSKN